jgi:hypothetical protein
VEVKDKEDNAISFPLEEYSNFGSISSLYLTSKKP